MPKNVLLSSLGLSPAVVTETIDALQNTGLQIDTVVLLTTSNERIVNTYIPLLQDDFADTYGNTIELIPAPITNDDIWTAQDNLEGNRNLRLNPIINSFGASGPGEPAYWEFRNTFPRKQNRNPGTTVARGPVPCKDANAEIPIFRSVKS